MPPIDPTENNHILDNPHIFLDEVMRQAKDSEIIRLSMYIRDGKALENYQGEKEQVQIFSTKEVQSGMYLWADQILCASNELRTAINNHVRILNGYGEEPVIGDKIISLRNQWDIISNNKIPLINGTIGYIEKSRMLSIYPPRFIYNKPLVCLNVQMKTDEGDMYENIPIDYIYFKTGEPQISQSVISALNKSPYFKHHVPCEFSYGYAITTWKAQGSEWDKVMGFEESFPRDKEEHQKFLYTMITRASKKLVLVKKP